MSQLKGFASSAFFLNEETNDSGGFGIWVAREDVMATKELTDPKLKETLEGILIGGTGREVLDVYKSSD